LCCNCLPYLKLSAYVCTNLRLVSRQFKHEYDSEVMRLASIKIFTQDHHAAMPIQTSVYLASLISDGCALGKLTTMTLSVDKYRPWGNSEDFTRK